MNTPWIVIDCDNLCHRNYYAMIASNKKNPVVYGFLRDLCTLREVLNSKHFIFCFDQTKHVNPRKDLYSGYKANHLPSPEREAITLQMQSLKAVLFSLGWGDDINAEDGWEADDFMGWIARHKDKDQECCLVTNDNDAWQLLSIPNTSIWDTTKKRNITHQYVDHRYHVSVEHWVKFKALVGDKADNIFGIPGIGEVRATQYLNGTATEKVKETIHRNPKLIALNTRLITIPFDDKTPCVSAFGTKGEYKAPSSVLWDDIMQEIECPGLIGKWS